MPHVIVNQARMLTYLREHMARSAARLEPLYGLQVDGITVGTGDEPVTVTLAHVEGGEATGETSTIRARYVVGCDGARSATRTAIGRELVGDPMNQAWGVMDVLVVTDFPDIRLKSAITSAEGSILIIPREGGYMVRLYIELDAVDGVRDVTPETLAAVANRILHPYVLEVRDVGWWSVYEVGQRLCDRFDDVPAGAEDRLPRVFIAGDACHTHSAKAGQGMNVSMADTWNLGWKLAAVLQGRARPELLRTYSEERQEVARRADRLRPRVRGHVQRPPRGTGADPEKFQRYFRDQGRFTAGVAVRYAPSMITSGAAHQHLAEGLPVGMRFHSAPVIRLADAKPMHLGHVARADGAWRLHLFADRDGSRLRALCAFLASPASPVVRLTPAGAEPDEVIDVRAVFQQGHRDLSVTEPAAGPAPAQGTIRSRRLREDLLPRPRGRRLRPARDRPRRGLRRGRAPGPVRGARPPAGRARRAGGVLRGSADRGVVDPARVNGASSVVWSSSPATAPGPRPPRPRQVDPVPRGRFGFRSIRLVTSLGPACDRPQVDPVPRNASISGASRRSPSAPPRPQLVVDALGAVGAGCRPRGGAPAAGRPAASGPRTRRSGQLARRPGRRRDALQPVPQGRRRPSAPRPAGPARRRARRPTPATPRRRGSAR